MLPYIDLPPMHLGPVPIQWFGILVVLGIWVGTFLIRWRARKVGVKLEVVESLITWMLVAGFVSAHVLDMIFYHPAEVLRRPWALLFIWEGLSSYGGFIGAVAGAFVWKRFRGQGQSLFVLGDLTLSVFPIGWIFGRMGCAVVHDHPGRLAAEGAWLAVAFPEGPRYDLGLLEMFLSVGISLVCVALWRVRPRVGTYIAVTTLIYAPVRFYMDFFRIDDPVAGDPRYGGLTPAQWACVAVFVYGIAVAVRVARSPKAPPVTALPTPTAT